MESIRKSVVIAVEPARVFEYLTDPAHLLQVWPNLSDVDNARTEADGGHSFDWTYRMAGVKLRGHARTVEVERPRKRVDRSEGAVPSTFRWSFQGAGGNTELALVVDYELPAVFGRLAAPLLRRLNERDAEALVSNVKLQLEGGGASPAR